MNVYEARHAGREYCCNTEGSDHYKEGGVEPLDLAIAKGLSEDFCIVNISKYAFRFKKTRNLEDLKKVSDYAHILCGVELEKQKAKQDKPETVKTLTETKLVESDHVKKPFDWEAFNNREFVVHCKTESEAKEFCVLCDKHDIYWTGGAKRSENTCWSIYREKTCYASFGYCCIKHFEDKHIPTVEWSDYMNGLEREE